MKKKRILAMILVVASCLLLAVSVSAAGATNRKATDFRDFDKSAWYADAFELAAGKSISALTLSETPEFGNTDCTVTITAFRDGKQIGSMQTELTLHTAYLWTKEVQ